MYDSFDELKRDCLSCGRCPLAGTRRSVVFGGGKEDAEVLFVGEGPGEQEDMTGQPFVGRGGRLLDKFLEVIDLDRGKNVYIANIIKCRPPGNRDPQPAEQETCIVWLREQVRLIGPKIIVCLGRIAAQRLISPDFKVTRQHGELVERGGVWLMGTFHPAALLRNPSNKPDALSDFVALRKKISEVCERTY